MKVPVKKLPFSVPALDSILLLADEATQEIDIENQKNMKNGYESFIKGLLQLLVGTLNIIFIPAYLKTRLIQLSDIDYFKKC